MSKGNKSKKAVHYQIARKFSTDNQICDQQILEVFTKYYTDKKEKKLIINSEKIECMFDTM